MSRGKCIVEVKKRSVLIIRKGVVSGKKVAEVYGHPRFSQFAPRISIRGAALAVHL